MDDDMDKKSNNGNLDNDAKMIYFERLWHPG
jgi:hypothetical protein